MSAPGHRIAEYFDGAPAALLQQTGQQTLERAFAALMKAEPVPA